MTPVDPNSAVVRVGRLISEYVGEELPKHGREAAPGSRTLEGLARDSGVTIETLRKLKNGRQGDVRLRTLDAIVSAVDPSLAWLPPSSGGFADLYADLAA